MPEIALTDQLLAVLFVASEPLTVKRLAQTTNQSAETIQPALAELTQQLPGGLCLSETGGQYRLVTAPETASVVRQFLQAEMKAELSRPALETLAIVAYRGPLTRPAIEQIRGVASDAILRNLTNRGLVQEAGRSHEPGRPSLYAVTPAFLHHFGLTSTADLPPLTPTSTATARHD